MSNLKYRLVLIVGLMVASIVALIPRNTIERVKRADGSIGYDTVKRVPLKRGLVVANGVGVVDSDYCGPNDEIMVQVLNIGTADVRVQRGDRRCQPGL